MSDADHAAVIRKVLFHGLFYAEIDDSTALAALDALLAERDAAREAAETQFLDVRNAINRAEAAEEVARHQAREIDEYEDILTRYREALREIARLGDDTSTEFFNPYLADKARAALEETS